MRLLVDRRREEIVGAALADGGIEGAMAVEVRHRLRRRTKKGVSLPD